MKNKLLICFQKNIFNKIKILP